ncbi:RNA binding protein Nova 1 [Echinococcus multilocularis]|uniref:RNA binding protein Nova 1 n=1 Tax=Echinococcus multilocularis TaxID=6211 RepID=A0A068Y7R3_ECHMU|nr:RNA binding protein Nova 1 [Echinococcus multilocularis]
MSGNDFKMTSVGEAELPTASDSDVRDESAEDVEVDVPQSKDFSLVKQCKIDNAHLKILVPSVAAGAIIGKNGEAITNIQNCTGAKVKMSKANDFYPGTNERVCLIIGTTAAITEVYDYISEKIYEKPETASRMVADGRVPYERHKQVKILVPNSTAGMIIGKGGSFIKEIKSKTGAFIQVSQKSREMSLAERCITVGGELNQTRETMRLLLTKIAEDPLSSSCPNISYIDVTGPVASAYPTGSPYALFSAPPTGPPHHHPSTTSGLSSCSPPGRCFMHPLQQQQQHHSGGGAASCGGPLSPPTAANGRVEASAAVSRRVLNGRGTAPQSLLGAASLPHGGGAGGASLWSSPTSPPFPISLDAVRGLLHSTGFTEDAMEDITRAMRVLNAYGLLSLTSLASWVGFGGGGCGGNGSRPGVSPQLTTVSPPTQPPQEATASSSPFGSPTFQSAPPPAPQQQPKQQQQPSSPVDTYYRPQDNGSGPSATTNTDNSSR